VAARRLTDLLRREQARMRREQAVSPRPTPALDDADDSLILLFMCCHPALTPASQIALTLRAVGGLTTAQVARAFLVPEATMTRRITRAKRQIKASGATFGIPRDAPIGAVLHVLYLIFTAGYADLQRGDLAAEAIRLTRLVHRLLPDDPEVAGLLALMLLTEARRPARIGVDGSLVPMAEQDRGAWHAAFIAEGVALITAALPIGPIGPYQLQAAISAVHDEAPSAEDTDWPQIEALYGLLLTIDDNPVVRLNHAVAVAMARGPAAGLELLAAIENDDRIAHDHRLAAARAHLLEMTGDHAAARHWYETAAQRAGGLAQQRYLHARAARLA
jgi:predicted RNA polymerase sigma factor